MSIVRTHTLFCPPSNQRDLFACDLKAVLDDFVTSLPPNLSIKDKAQILTWVNRFSNSRAFQQIQRSRHLAITYQRLDNNKSQQSYYAALRKMILGVLPLGTALSLLPIARAETDLVCQTGVPTGGASHCTNPLNYCIDLYWQKNGTAWQVTDPQAWVQFVCHATGMASSCSSEVYNNLVANLNATAICKIFGDAFANFSTGNLTNFVANGPIVGNWLCTLNGNNVPADSVPAIEQDFSVATNSSAYQASSTGLSTASIVTLSVCLSLACLVITAATAAYCCKSAKPEEEEMGPVSSP